MPKRISSFCTWEKFHFFASELAVEKSTKQASTVNRAPGTSLQAAARGDPVLKAGLNKLLCSAL